MDTETLENVCDNEECSVGKMSIHIHVCPLELGFRVLRNLLRVYHHGIPHGKQPILPSLKIS